MMILSNVKIKYMKEENHFEDVQNLFDDGYGLALGWKDYSITQLFIIEEENLMDINLFIGNKKYKCTKDPILLRQRELLTIILMNNSEKFARRRSRKGTEQAYFRAMIMYFSLLIQKSNKNAKNFVGDKN